MNTQPSRAPSQHYTRPPRVGSLQHDSLPGPSRVIQPILEDGPPPGHPHAGPINYRYPIRSQRPATPPAPTLPPPAVPLPATPRPPRPQPVVSPPSPAVSEMVLETAEDDPYDAPPTPTRQSPVYGGIVDDAAQSPVVARPQTPIDRVLPPSPPLTPAPASPVAASPQPAPAQPTRPLSVVLRPLSAGAPVTLPADVEIEVRGATGARVVTIRLRS